MLRHVDGMRAHLGAAWAAERQRVFLWVPVLFGAGGGLYLTLPVEPIGWIAPAAAGLSALAALLLRRHTAPALGLAALALLAAGVAAADWRTDRVSAPVLAGPIGPTDVSGRVVWVGAGAGPGPGPQRYLLDRVSIGGLAAAETPARADQRSQHGPRRRGRAGILAHGARFAQAAADTGRARGVGLRAAGVVPADRRRRLRLRRAGADGRA